ncbi:MAG: hypothetical protein RBS39_06500 [Phycisphaerales bacterium]|jgi:hypothetical protein|nr:hypothetical protein [Phycisphaerales bacterium]
MARATSRPDESGAQDLIAQAANVKNALVSIVRLAVLVPALFGLFVYFVAFGVATWGRALMRVRVGLVYALLMLGLGPLTFWWLAIPMAGNVPGLLLLFAWWMWVAGLCVYHTFLAAVRLVRAPGAGPGAGQHVHRNAPGTLGPHVVWLWNHAPRAVHRVVGDREELIEPLIALATALVVLGAEAVLSLTLGVRMSQVAFVPVLVASSMLLTLAVAHVRRAWSAHVLADGMLEQQASAEDAGRAAMGAAERPVEGVAGTPGLFDGL